MKVGDLVVAEIHTNEKILGLVTDVHVNPLTGDSIDLMFPYYITFINGFPSDWYGSDTLEIISESR